MGSFVLSDQVLDRTYLGQQQTARKFDDMSFRDWEFKSRGHTMIALPFEGHVRLNPTGPPGFTSSILISATLQLRKWEYFVQKFDEFIEVNPVYQQYYQLTVKQKQELEAQIKSGLASAAQAVADLELLLHDERKYKEFLDYFGLQYDESKNTFKETGKKDEHSMKSVFIDLVDVHTGEGIAIKSIVQRWPTLIIDFMKMEDSDIDPDKVKEKLDISKAEGVVLVTKNKLYQEWKRLFGAELQNRYRRIIELVRSRRESVNQYRKWMEPTIARHKMLAEGFGSRGGRTALSTFFLTPIGHATAFGEITMWAWRELPRYSPELFKGGTEFTAQEIAERRLRPYDDWTKKNLVFHPQHGLVVDYPWITDEWVKEQETWLTSRESQGRANIRAMVDRSKLYYGFFVLSMEKYNYRSAAGGELEDSVFDINFMVLSQNALFAKLLELRAKQIDFNHYIDDLIGIREPTCPICMPKGKRPKEERDYLAPVKKFLDFFNLEFAFSKPGPYDRDWDERVVKHIIRPAMSGRYAPFVRFIKQKSGYGT